MKIATESEGIHGKARRMEAAKLEEDIEMKRTKSKKRGKAYFDMIKKASKEHAH